jgi:hypothetical protein
MIVVGFSFGHDKHRMTADIGTLLRQANKPRSQGEAGGPLLIVINSLSRANFYGIKAPHQYVVDADATTRQKLSGDRRAQGMPVSRNGTG